MCWYVVCDDNFFTVRRYAGAMYVMALCLSQVSVLLNWLNVGSRKQHHTVAQGF